MPTQIQGFNKDGESKWFDGHRLPEGWYPQDPTKSEVLPGDCPCPEDKPKAKAKSKKKSEPSREPEAAE